MKVMNGLVKKAKKHKTYAVQALENVYVAQEE